MPMQRINSGGVAIAHTTKTAQSGTKNQNVANTAFVQQELQSKGAASLFRASLFLGK